ncbi:MAG: hypothetical protein MK102_10360 [Fuerstiella sp.]|nr:hypothetical protein [Fuerstiella sp.]
MPSLPVKPNVLLFVTMAALAWGVYVPLVHGAASKLGSSLRAFLMVGVAYFLTAVLVPCLFIFWMNNDPTVRDPTNVNFRVPNMMWGLAAGVAGAAGALCVIFAAKAAGPGAALYVAPLVFAGAPIINTIAAITIFSHGKTAAPSAPFYLGLVLAAAGAAMVMVYKPGEIAEKPSVSHQQVETGNAAE